MLVDSHCHLHLLDLTSFDNKLDGVLQAARNANVGQMLCVSVDLQSVSEVLQCAEHYENVYASVGVHPNHHQGNLCVEQLTQLGTHTKVVAIGETGLDYFRNKGDIAWQRDAFRIHITAAKHSRKPLIIHTRAARDDTLQIMHQEHAQEIGGVMHCFTESWDMAKAAIEEYSNYLE